MSRNEITRANRPPRDILVWDPLVRLGHWALLAAFAVAFFSAEEEAGGPDPSHVWGGYAVGLIVVLRVLWGFVGPPHARFVDFARSPFETLIYLRNLLRGRARGYVGHSPAGGAMVIALLICLAATVATGMMAYGEQGKGPLAGIDTTPVSSARAGGDQAEHATRRGGGQGAETAIDELHNLFAEITVALVIAHICGVALASFVHRENLVLSMITGRKRRGHDG